MCKIANLIGSTREENRDYFTEAEKVYTSKGYIVTKPALFGNEVNEEDIDALTKICDAKMKLCDLVVVVTKENVPIGESTKSRIKECINTLKDFEYFVVKDDGKSYLQY